jgi:superoxide dismutase, Fe-Mn family
MIAGGDNMTLKHGSMELTRFSRRRFLTLSAQAGVLLFAGSMLGCKQSRPAIALPDLPYAEDALEPIISKITIQHHYGYHHKGYIETLNKLVAQTPLAGQPLEDIIRASADRPESQMIFNNAAQAWNHNFYWQSLASNGGGNPPGVLKKKIDNAFGSVKNFKRKMINAAVTRFSNGWVWLVSLDNTLKVVTTQNADLPMAEGMTPLLTIDIWEHAYYLDYQHRRSDYVKAILDKLINWSFAQKNLSVS